jgi:hypothetical protein
VVESIDDAPLSELLKKGETIAAAVDRQRLRLRECAADRHRVNSAPWPSSEAKAAARLQIERLSDVGAPNLDAAIEFGQPISFATTTLRSIVRNVETPGAIAHADVPDFLGLLCWLFPAEILKRVSAGLDEIADDKAALSQQQREQMEAEINQSVLAIERAECALIWHAEAAGEIIDFRSDTTPMAALGVRLVTVPHAAAPDGHAFDVAGWR